MNMHLVVDVERSAKIIFLGFAWAQGASHAT